MKRIRVIQGDITKLNVDAIVNAANSGLRGGGGVDGAIHRAGGPAIMEACKIIREREGGCPTGQAVITTGGRLGAKFIIHTVGPVWKDGTRDEELLLRNAYVNSMKLAVQNNLKTIAFPNISTGVYGFPKPRAANIAVSAVIDFPETDSSLDEVIFCCFDNENFEHYNKLIS